MRGDLQKIAKEEQETEMLEMARGEKEVAPVSGLKAIERMMNGVL